MFVLKSKGFAQKVVSKVILKNTNNTKKLKDNNKQNINRGKQKRVKRCPPSSNGLFCSPVICVEYFSVWRIINRSVI